MGDERTTTRVIYIGHGRRLARGATGWLGRRESDRDWRQRLAAEMDDASQEMARRGLRLVQVVPAFSTSTLQGSWTEGAWLVFGPAS